jgi:hypothetical protein
LGPPTIWGGELVAVDGGRGKGLSVYHDGKVPVVDAVVVDGWLEKVGVLLQPGVWLAVMNQRVMYVLVGS